jgi:DNA polymerase-3 subunit alpha
MRVIEAYDHENIFTVQGRSYPALALLEDADGIRLLLCDGSVPVDVWHSKAEPSGAAYLVYLTGDDEVHGAQTAQQFAETRQDDLRLRRYNAICPIQGWDHLPSYVEVVQGVQEAPARPQAAELRGFVHTHAHSEYSPLDGLSTVKEMVDVVVSLDQPALSINDHGFVTGHYDLSKHAEAAGIKPIFGIEAYFVDDRLLRPEPGDKEAIAALKDYYHLILWAKDDRGLHNLWALSTESNRDGFYGKARMDWDLLERYSEGIMASTACLRGPLTHKALLDGREDVARTNLARLLNIYGDDLFVEIHANHLPEQIEVNHRLVALARSMGVPLIGAADSHYPTPADAHTHRVWLSVQTESDVADDSSLFAGNQRYDLMSEADFRDAISYLGPDVVDECVASTLTVANRATARLEKRKSMPVFVKTGGPQRDAELLRERCMENWHLVQGKTHPEEDYLARFEEEYGLLVAKGYCGYFLQVSDYTTKARRNKVLVGPGRGSGGGSLIAYLLEITAIDPVEADLLFARFLTPGRESLPDFDVDFPQSRKQWMQEYVVNRWGEEYTAVVGSVMRLKSKGVVDKLSKALKSELPESVFPDVRKFSDFVKMAEADTAGLGMSWEDLWSQHEETLQPFRDKYPTLFDMADRLVMRVNTYGQHAAGMVISTDEPLTGRLPMRRSGDHMVTQFDMRILDELGFVKFDILTLRTLDTIQDTLDLIRERRGIDIDVYAWREEYFDPQVWEELADGHTLGVFQIETASSTPLVKRMKPRSVTQLADAITLVRPGPKNSGLTEAYLKRRVGEEEVTYPDERMVPSLESTYGAMIYQEQIMAACMVLAGYDSTEADGVRGILGKKKVDKVASAGQEFVQRAVEWGGMDQDAAQRLWAQMAEFAKYSFNKAHAYGYAVLAYWCAWLKVHYPAEFITSALSTVDKDRIPEFIKEARRLGIQVLPPDVNESGVGFKAVSNLAIRYGLDSVKGIGEASARGVMEGQPYTDFEDFLERRGLGADMGTVRLLARIGAFDSLFPNRRALETRLLEQKEGLDSLCVFKTLSGPLNEHGLPCVFDWANEPPPVNPKTGKMLKPKPVPKKCTKACRQYKAPEARDHAADVEPYTDADIREIEQDMLGIHLSSTPFDMLDAQTREDLRDEAERAQNASRGDFLLAAIITRVKPHKDRSGKPMGFLDLSTEVSDLSLVVFNTKWESMHKKFKPGALCIVDVSKNDRGFTLNLLEPIV